MENPSFLSSLYTDYISPAIGYIGEAGKGALLSLSPAFGQLFSPNSDSTKGTIQDPAQARAVATAQANATGNDKATENVGKAASAVSNASNGLQGGLGISSSFLGGGAAPDEWNEKKWAQARTNPSNYYLGR